MEPGIWVGGGSYTEYFERWMKYGSRNGASLSGSYMKGTLRECFFTGEPKDTSNMARKWAPASVGAPLLGNMDWLFFLEVFLLEEFL